ncbi:MAG: hypothetical protein EZS26_001575 [Candidatus Ordinivivax streblomastigis]|uniref:Uncharacterized protein n=1 Tax=Candidatus Ordinivivax streblomastigis TaxID=2540710 RepID=A0A5M8P1A7_9BACT|nr:MAG: hypothetical protein EZS26_001575 [Candidatus Ordinivivax streblomastigis]
MQKIKLYLIAIALLWVSGPVFAFGNRTGFKERNEQWLQHSSSGGLRGDSDPDIPGGTDPPISTPDVERDGAVGDALPWLIALGLFYGLRISAVKAKKIAR